jgi:cation transporter-like permease
MIELLINLVVFCVVGGLIYYLITLLPLPAPFPTIIRVALIVILILLILGMFTGWTPVYRVR